MSATTTIAIPIFEGLTALDAVGPYEVLQRVSSFDVVFVGHEHGVIRTDNSMLGLVRDATFEELAHPDVIVFPGGHGTKALESDERVLEWVRSAHATSAMTTSVCSGSIVLAAAGLLEGLTATTHWSVYPDLEAHGAIAVADRVVEHLDERLITAAGVSSGIDMALRLVELLIDRTAAQACQLMIEYDPQPPVDTGSVAKADDVIMARVIEYVSTGRR